VHWLTLSHTTLDNDIIYGRTISSTYDHRTLRTELPVRSAVLKQCTGGLVVRWVTTSESPLLYVFAYFLRGNEDWSKGRLLILLI
jgi:hypothetical protein